MSAREGLEGCHARGENELKSGMWMAASIVCLVLAAACWFANRTDALFVFAALGALAWFLNLRQDFQQKNLNREAAMTPDAD